MVADGARHFLQARRSTMGAETIAIATALVERYEQSTSAQLWHKPNSHFRCNGGSGLNPPRLRVTAAVSKAGYQSKQVHSGWNPNLPSRCTA